MRGAKKVTSCLFFKESNNAMAEEQRNFRIMVPWILTVVLTLWSECGNGQGQGKWKHF